MDSQTLYRAFQGIDDTILQRSQTLRRRGRWKKFAAVAACFVLLTGSLLSAEAAEGGVSNLLAPLFGYAQTELVDTIGRPLDVSVSADGYTLTADAVIGDGYNVAVVYTLRREDGQPIGEGVYFDGWETDVVSFSSGGGSLTVVPNEEHPDQLQLIESWSRSFPLFGRYVTVTFSDLTLYREGQDDQVLAQGPWELSYTLRYRDSSQSVDPPKEGVTGETGRCYQPSAIRLSPIGLHIQGSYSDAVWGENNALRDFTVALRMTDGTLLPLTELGSGYSMAKDDGRAKFHVETMFEQPIDLEEVEALVLCGTDLPLR